MIGRFFASLISLIIVFGLTFAVAYAITGVNLFDRAGFVVMIIAIVLGLSALAALEKPE